MAIGAMAEAMSAQATPTYIAISRRWLRLLASDWSVNSKHARAPPDAGRCLVPAGRP